MAFTLHVNLERLIAHLRATATDAVLPVIKGNGYGYGNERLVQLANHLGHSHIAVGTVFEAVELLPQFSGTITVLEPYEPSDSTANSAWQKLAGNEQLVATVARPVASAPVRRIWLEGRTQMNRFGWTIAQLRESAQQIADQFEVLGLALHLPLSEPSGGRIAAIQKWQADYRPLSQSFGFGETLSLSHISLKQAAAFDDVLVRLGSALWLGADDAYSARGTVLAVHNADLAGYRLRRTKQVLVVSGGTSHGVGLSAPANPASIRARLVAVANGKLEALGILRSPFKLDGKRLRFIEPPHMQVSMLHGPGQEVAVGTEIPVRVRMTTARFDEVFGL